MKSVLTGPPTSHRAADRSRQFAGKHADRILLAIEKLDANNMWVTQTTIAEVSGLTVAQVSKRLCEIERAGHIRVIRQSVGRGLVDVAFEGCRCWRLV